MGKFTDVEAGVYGVFGTAEWQAEDILTVPSNFTSLTSDAEFIRVAVIPSSEGVNRNSVNGILIIDIFTAAGQGTSRASAIADKLDDFLSGETLGGTQCFDSTLVHKAFDADNKALFRSSYTINFKFFGVN